MLLITANILTSTLLVTIITSIFYIIIEKSNIKKRKKNIFESGFDLITIKKSTFTTNFLLISIIFLIFDVEVVFLIPTTILNKRNEIIWLTCLLFLNILTIIIIKEWKQGALEWSK